MLLETEMRACYTFWEEKERATSLQIAALLSEDWVVPAGHSLLQVTTRDGQVIENWLGGPGLLLKNLGAAPRDFSKSPAFVSGLP